MNDNSERVLVKGIQFYAGTEIKNPKIYKSFFKKINSLLKKLTSEQLGKIEFLDVGGGFGVKGYSKKSLVEKYFEYKGRNVRLVLSSNKPELIDFFARKISSYFKKYILPIQGLKEINLKLEIGRWLINPCMVLLSQIKAEKESCVLVDAGINMFPSSIINAHSTYNLSDMSRAVNKSILKGPLCKTNDIVSKKYFGEKLKEGNILCFTNVGAYNISFAQQFGSPLPPIVAKSYNKLKLIRKKESFDSRFENYT